MEKIEDKIGYLTIKDIVARVEANNFLLPMLQRDYVWDPTRVANLFDSIYKNYPTSNLILLQLPKAAIKSGKIEFYEIPKQQTENLFDNAKISPEQDTIYCIMDGQQRITSIYLAIKNYLKKKKRVGFKQEELFFNAIHSVEAKEEILSDELDDDGTLNSNIFASKDAEELSASGVYIKVKDIYETEDNDVILENLIEKLDRFIYKTDEIGNFVIKKDGKRDEKQSSIKKTNALKIKKIIETNKSIIIDNIDNFRNLLNDKPVIEYSIVSLEDLGMTKEIEVDGGIKTEYTIDADTLLNIFFRLNSGGKALTSADLLFSKITIYAKDNKMGGARELFSKYISELNEKITKDNNAFKFKFTIDVFMRALWMFFGTQSTFKSFLASDNIKEFCTETCFKNVYLALKKARDLFVKAEYNSKNMTYNMLLPIAYYCYNGGETKDEDAIEMSKYFATSMLTNYFGSHSDSTLVAFRNAMNVNKDKLGLFKVKDKYKFNFKLLQDKLNERETDNKFKVSEDNIKRVFKLNYKKNYDEIKQILFMLCGDWYKQTIITELDHMHAKSFAENKIDKYKNAVKDKFDEEEYKYFVKNYNNFANLQLLTKEDNIKKLDQLLTKWFDMYVEEEQKTLAKKYFIPYESQDDLELSNFRNFYENRAKLMSDKLCEMFNIRPIDKVLE